MERNEIISQLQGGLIVSCQASPREPLDSPGIIAATARAVMAHGAVGIRANRPENIRAIRKATRAPIIGLLKRDYPGSKVYITPRLEDALTVVDAGADIIALDATCRRRPYGASLKHIIRELRRKTSALLMADISTLEEGIDAARLGFDFISTTLAGYTDYTTNRAKEGLPDCDLISELHKQLPRHARIVAEGRIAVPQHAVEMLRRGAFAVVVGTAITNPVILTQQFSGAIQRHRNSGGASAIGVDIGGTKTSVALVSSDGVVSHKHTVTTPWNQGAAAIVSRITEGIHQVLRESGRPVQAIGIGATGRVNSVGGYVFDGVPLAKDYFGFPLVRKIASAFGKPVVLENDANAAAYAEHRIGKGTRARRLVCLTIGTGIGGGIVIDGKLFHANGNAGEIGHICVVAHGRKCPCGRHGCLERYVSRKQMQAELTTLVSKGKLHLPPGCAAIDTKVIMRWIKSGQPCAMQVFNRQMDYLAAGLESVFNLVDPDLVVLSGEISRLDGILTRALQKRLRRPLRITTSALHNDAGLVGAALLALETIKLPLR